jgi:signal transduction histidine kinase/CheY-like chemotaxis protein
MPVVREMGRGASRVYELGSVTLIGRGPDSTIRVADSMVSLRHAEIRLTEQGEYRIVDLQSRHGTTVGGRKVAEALLRHGDEILVGMARLRFEDHPVTEDLLPDEVELRRIALLESNFRPAAAIGQPEELSRDYERLRVAFELTRAIGVEHDAAALIDRILDTALRLFQGDRAAIALLDGAGIPTAQLAKLRSGERVEMPLSSRMLSEVMATRAGVVTADTGRDERFSRSASVIALQIRSAMCVPIVYQNELLGVLQLDSKGAVEPFTEKDLELFIAIASQAAMAIKNAKLVARVQTVIAEDWKRLERVMHALPEGVLLLDAGNRLSLTNNRADELLPLVSEARRGNVLEHIGGVSIDELLARRAGDLTELTVPGTPPRVFTVSAAHTAGKAAGEAETVVVIREVTEEREREARANQQEKLALIGQLAGGVAHDFNNLLAVILNYSDFVRDDVQTESVRDDIDQIKEAARRAAELTKQLLAFSRREMISPRVFDLDRLVANMNRMMLRTLGEQIVFRTIPSPDPLPVKADPSRIEQVLMNLLVNARDAMPKGGTITVESSLLELDAQAAASLTLPPGPYGVISVRDTGTGMPAEVMTHVFEPFFTTKERGKGTGLGLATAYGIVKQVGGHISVESTPGAGTTFQVMLPTTEEGLPSEGVMAGQLIAPAHETVLLVEDESGVRELTRRILSQAGYQVIEASNGEDALTLLGKHTGRIHLLLSDLVMPGMSGKELAERVVREHREIPVLFMSGYIDRDVAGEGLFADGRTLITKPFTREELLRRVRASLPAS